MFGRLFIAVCLANILVVNAPAQVSDQYQFQQSIAIRQIKEDNDQIIRPFLFEALVDCEKNLNQLSLQRDGQTKIRMAISREINAYLEQFKGTLFGKVISIGDPAIFEKKINERMNLIYTGSNGSCLISKYSKKAKSYHYSWKVIGRNADLVFPFEPSSSIKDLERQTLMHEMTHHIEWLNGVKESSKEWMIYDNPRSERNTNYQDSVVDALSNWKETEDAIRAKRENLPNAIQSWKQLQKTLTKLEKGSVAGNNPPDANLEAMNGFNVKFDTIRKSYLSGSFGEDFKTFAMLADMLPKMNPQLDLTKADDPVFGSGDTAEIGVGEQLLVSVGTVDSDRTDEIKNIDLDPKFKFEFYWNAVGLQTQKGKTFQFKAKEAGESYDVNVELRVPFNNRSYVVARGNFVVKVKPKISVTEQIRWESKWGNIRTFVRGIDNLKTSSINSSGNSGTNFTAQGNKVSFISIESEIGAEGAPGVGDMVDLEGNPVARDPSYSGYKITMTIKAEGETLFTRSSQLTKDGGRMKFAYNFDPAKHPNKKNLTVEVSISGGKAEFGTGFVKGSVLLSSSENIKNIPKTPPSMSDTGNQSYSAKGQVDISRDGKTLNPANKGTSLKTGDQIKTADSSTASFKLADVVNLLLNSNSLLTITNDSKLAPSLRLSRGNLKISLPKMPTGTSLKIEMSQAIANVKGTSFELWENGDRSAIRVDEGVVEFRQKTTGATTNVSAGQTFVSTPQGLAVVLNTPQPKPNQEKLIFSTANDYGVANGGKPPAFTLNIPVIVTYIMTYHWNNGQGTPGGTITLKNSAGKVFGPWKVNVRNNVYWEVNPKIQLPPGTYQVIDSSPTTWAHNPQSGGRGMTVIKGYAVQ